MKNQSFIKYCILFIYILTFHQVIFAQYCQTEVPFPSSGFNIEEEVELLPAPTLAPTQPRNEITPSSSYNETVPHTIRLVQADVPSDSNRQLRFSNGQTETISTPPPLGSSSRQSQENRRQSAQNNSTWLNVEEDENDPLFQSFSKPKASPPASEIQWDLADSGVNFENIQNLSEFELYGDEMGMYGAYPSPHSQYIAFLAENITFSLGGTGFQSPVDYGSGAYGMSESFNWVSPSVLPLPISLQAGFRAVQSDMCGSHIPYTNAFKKNAREQLFGTFGAFYRGAYIPIQLGVVYDYLSDHYDQKYKLQQLRTELAYISKHGYEFGFRGAFGMKNDTIRRWIHYPHYNSTHNLWEVKWHSVSHKVQPNNYYSLFLRKYYANGGQGTLSIGSSNYGDILAGADFTIPLNDYVSLQNSLTYVVPKEGHAGWGPVKESWNIMLQLTYQPRGGILAGFCDPFRAMFDVADNGSFLQRIK